MKVTAAASAVCLAGAACSSGSSSGRTVEGTVVLIDTEGAVGGLSNCSGAGGYSDLRPGAKVTVRDGSDKVVGVAALEHFSDSAQFSAAVKAGGISGSSKKMVNEATKLEADGMGKDYICPFHFSVKLPDSDTYSITIGGRDPLVEKRSDLDRTGSHVVYSIGDSA